MLIFVAVLALGLTRQLGNFIVPRREQIAYELGPDVGRVIAAPVLLSDEAEQLKQSIHDGPTEWGAIIVVDERCHGCEQLLVQLEETGAPENAPVVVLSRDSGPEHRARLERFADLVIVDGERLKAADLNATPFVMLVDRDLKLRFKDVLPDLRYAVDKWRDERHAVPEPVGRSPEGAAESPALQLQIHGGQ
jgi:hypothetical protein